MKHEPDAFASEAATDEPASPSNPAPGEAGDAPPASAPAEGEAEELDPLGHPLFASEAEDDAYWRGIAAGLRMTDPPAPESGPAPDARPFETRRQRQARFDGFTGPKRAVFLEGLAEGKTVVAAAAAAGVSKTAVYNLRNRREGRAFDIACEAAIRRARRVLADRQRDRAIEGQVTTRYDKDGNIVGSRHYHDNRLATAVLTRLDNKVAACRDDEQERLVGAVAEEFEELLDCIEVEGDAEAFVEARRPLASMPARREPEPRFDDVEPEDMSDLDPAEMDDWTDDQWERAFRQRLSRTPRGGGRDADPNACFRGNDDED
jgi:hypothetical protein